MDGSDNKRDENIHFFSDSDGINKKTGSYWSTDPTISTPFFGSKMAKDRFMAILSNLHLVDNDNHPTGRLYKLNPFIRMMRRIFDVYSPEEMLSFNEGTCPIKGRVKFRVYNPKSHTNLD